MRSLVENGQKNSTKWERETRQWKQDSHFLYLWPCRFSLILWRKLWWQICSFLLAEDKSKGSRIKGLRRNWTYQCFAFYPLWESWRRYFILAHYKLTFWGYMFFTAQWLFGMKWSQSLAKKLPSKLSMIPVHKLFKSLCFYSLFCCSVEEPACKFLHSALTFKLSITGKYNSTTCH